jgi:hypothetical protein
MRLQSRGMDLKLRKCQVRAQGIPVLMDDKNVEVVLLRAWNFKFHLFLPEAL